MLFLGDGDAVLHSNRSQAYYLEGRLKDAVDDATKAIELRPWWAKAYYRQAVALKALGSLQEAVVATIQTLILDTDALQARELLQNLLWQLLVREL